MEPNDYAKQVARVVADALERANLSQRHVAHSTGIPPATLSRRLNGVTPFVITELYSIARVLDVPVDTLTKAAA